jgi:hypothetical protein
MTYSMQILKLLKKAVEKYFNSKVLISFDNEQKLIILQSKSPYYGHNGYFQNATKDNSWYRLETTYESAIDFLLNNEF